jgi:hypothetical protein
MGDAGKRRDRVPGRRSSIRSRVRAVGAVSLAPTAAATGREFAAAAGAGDDGGSAVAPAVAVARGDAATTISGRALAAAPPTTATVDAAATTLVIDTALAVAPLPSDVLTRCGKASSVIHSATGRRPE